MFDNFSDYYLVLPIAAAAIFMAVMITLSIEERVRQRRG